MELFVCLVFLAFNFPSLGKFPNKSRFRARVKANVNSMTSEQSIRAYEEERERANSHSHSHSHSHLGIITMVSGAYSHSSPTLSLPPLSPPKIHGCLSSPTILTPVSTLKSSGFPPRLSINGNLNSHRNRFRANSVDPDGDVQITTQFTQGNDGISKDTRGSNPSTSFLSVLCPLLKLFSGGDPAQERNYFLEVATSSLSTLARLPWGSRSLTDNLHSQEMSAVDPPNNLQLFEFGFSTEACPFCRRVREAITELDLSVEIYPCPKGSIRHREMVRSVGGKEQFPFLMDPNTGMSMYESGEIVKYLFQQYGNGRSPSTGLLESTLITGWMPTILRAGRGMSLWEKARTEPPPKKLELFSYENNPVRQRMCGISVGKSFSFLSLSFSTSYCFSRLKSFFGKVQIEKLS
ncbi:hypothetical protein RHMOL_Rhmol12G0004100 [Rhododendron molle]|uniref:Uncharacterized protein n=1 Tax=Rhododendron molle TaxID=49168 RepID=A0ACC0LCP6_RHOML|nr:hypothetical protein RHMOL_Rhmol12G0004100 [Rhododendron molle]